jgi:ribosomal protein S18 acetylase RimI-like enzyme
MEFRRATKADVEAFVDVRMEFVTQIRTIADVDDFRARTREYLTEHIEMDDLLVYLALEDGEIVSSCMASLYQTPPVPSCPTGRTAELLNVYTKQEFRRRGLAEQLIRMLFVQLRQRGVEKVLLDYTEEGLPLYQKLGFVVLPHQMELKLMPERE